MAGERRLILSILLFLALAGCGRNAQTAIDHYEKARALERGEQYKAALAEAGAALNRAERGSLWYWRARLLRVEILLEQREINLAQQALDFQIPSGPQWNGERARYRLCQATIAYNQRQYDQAAGYLDQAQALAGQTGPLMEIESLRASVAIRQGRFAEADALTRHVLAGAERAGDMRKQMRAKGKLGFVHLQAGQYEEAIPWFEQSLEMAHALGAADDEARSKLNLGWCYYRLGDLDKAQRYCEEAVPEFERTGNRQDSHTCRGNIGSILLSRRDYAAAARNYESALQAATALGDRDSRAYWLNNLAMVKIETGDWDTAERYNNEAREFWKNNANWLPYSTANAAHIAAGRKQFAEAEKLYHAVIETPPRDPAPLISARTGLAHMLAAEGKDKEAEAAYRATDALIEQLRQTMNKIENRLVYFATLADFYRDYVEFKMSRGRAGEALEVAESSRARVLLDKLLTSRARPGAGTAASFQRFAAGYGGVLLSYWMGTERSYLWAVTASEVKVFTLPGEARIRSLVDAYDAFIQNARDALDTDYPAGRQLYDALIAPAAAVAPKGSHVIIVPDGPLNSLNFETLPVMGGAPHYWIEDVTLAVTPSLDLLELDKGGRKAAAGSLLLIGNPVSPVAQYPDLQFAAQEMDGITRNMASFRQVVRTREAADPEAYTGSSPGGFTYIHFVAHAVATPQEPLGSAVILSRHGGDYMLRASDVIAEPLNASLVTISACRGAGARTYAGEGLVGLTWAFLQAGARNVIAGLWDVNDRSTAELSTALYAGLARGMDPAAALRAAKLEMIRAQGAYRKPYYWGPFEVFVRAWHAAPAGVTGG